MELNPALDVRNKTAELAVDLIESLFGKSTLMRRPVWRRRARAASQRPIPSPEAPPWRRMCRANPGTQLSLDWNSVTTS